MKFGRNLIVLLFVVLMTGITITNGLKCEMCGQYNEGVGSITPCLNYTPEHPEAYLKECTKPTEKFCVKYVTLLSTVRDCATECTEKEIWESQIYCCNEDGCNSGNFVHLSSWLLSSILLIFIVISILIQY